MIEVRNISKKYAGVAAVDALSFTVEKGVVFGLLGPNGAGKTTTLNIIAGVFRPDEGTVVVDGLVSSTDNARIQSKIGYLSENNPLYGNLMVYEMLDLSRKLKNVSTYQFETRKDYVINVCGIAGIYYRPIETLSKGLRQRVGIAVAMIGNPDILILDEPTEGLDPNQRQDIRTLIRDLRKEHTVVVSTHVMQEVEAMCDDVIILDEGRIAIAGKVAALQGVKDGVSTIEFELAGLSAPSLVSSVGSTFDVLEVDKGYSVTTSVDQEHELYKLLAEHTSGEAYLTRLSKKTNKLEQIFRNVTKKGIGDIVNSKQ